ncbi:MAG: TIGR03621 family F420-dependent LLM class oxidoreductase [Chloroflexi bacterium]|nr:TIGR03621 family F420-dependent LLM class oxidoreductase [Chloroflexota bacterium]
MASAGQLRPFRLAITATTAASATEWRAKARRVEELGYSTLLITDHLTAQLAPLPALAAAADATTTLRLGTFVLANDYRNPVMLAKEAATLDVLSGGRLELGIGAGWATRDYEMLGIPYDPPAKRVERLREAIVLMKRLWTEDRVEHSGRHYTVRAANVLPKPVQRPHPPLMIGGGGPVMLRLAVKHADIVAFAPQVNQDGKGQLTHLSAGATDEKVRLVRAAAGDRLDRLELNAIVFDAGVADDPSSLLAHAATRFKGAVAGVVDSPYFLYGSLGQLRTQLLARRERFGISYYAIPEKVMEPFAPLARELSAL